MPSHLNAVSEKQESSSDDEYLYNLDNKPKVKKSPSVTVKVGHVPIVMIVDTGASTDIMDETTFTNIICSSKIELQPTSKSIFAFGSQEQLTLFGLFDKTVMSVLKGNHGSSLLSYQTAFKEIKRLY